MYAAPLVWYHQGLTFLLLLAIVKLFIRYEFMKPNSWSMGTGWLISPDVLVTAGHCR